MIKKIDGYTVTATWTRKPSVDCIVNALVKLVEEQSENDKRKTS